MSHFAYSFCISLFHSVWQAGLLLLMYVVCSRSLLKNVTPGAKRNFLFILIVSQLVLTSVTFFIYFLRPEQLVTASLNEMINNYLPAKYLQPLTPFVFAAYLFVIFYKASRTILGWYRFNQVYKAGLQKAPLDLRLFTMLKAEQFCIKRPVKLLVSNTIDAPSTFGFLKPVILLPVALINQISLQQAETLIIHELTHIKANDFLQNWIVIFAETIFFFNPFITRICKQIKLEREKNCDTTVMHFNYSPTLYAQTLLQAEKLRQALPALQVAAVSSKQQLLQRIYFFADASKTNNRKRNIAAPVVLLFSLLFFTVYSIIQFSIPQPKQITSSIKVPAVAATELPVSFKTAAVDVPVASSIETTAPIKIAFQKKPVKRSTSKPEELIEENSPEGFSLATFSDEQLTKQVIVQEEASGSKTSTLKVYTLVFKNGEWVMVPGWMATSRLLPVDSLPQAGDSTLIRQTLQQQ